MVDPFSLVAAAAAVGGATSKFVEKAWDAGENWISSYFANHGAKAKEKAKKNSLEFLSELAKKVGDLEKKDEKNKKLIEEALSNPDFSILLQKAILSSAQTENKQKYELLARLVSDRLAVDPESIYSLTSKLAVDAISVMNANQLKLLALIMNVHHITPKSIPADIKSQEDFDDYVLKWLESRFEKLLDVEFLDLDLHHLEALSCLTIMRVGSMILQTAISKKFKSDKFKFDGIKFNKSEIAKKLIGKWNQGLRSVALTSVGQLIGVYVSDVITGTDTDLSKDWK